MSKLLISILAIALTLILAAASVYRGGSAFTSLSSQANANARISEARDISQALSFAREKGVTAASVQSLVSAKYLRSSMPGWQLRELTTGSYTGIQSGATVLEYVVSSQDDCRAINSLAKLGSVDYNDVTVSAKSSGFACLPATTGSPTGTRILVVNADSKGVSALTSTSDISVSVSGVPSSVASNSSGSINVIVSNLATSGGTSVASATGRLNPSHSESTSNLITGKVLSCGTVTGGATCNASGQFSIPPGGSATFTVSFNTGAATGYLFFTPAASTINSTDLSLVNNRIASSEIGIGLAPPAPPEVTFTPNLTASSGAGCGPGTAGASYAWTVPAGVTSISAVAIGGGSGAYAFNAGYQVGDPGGGGALTYSNNMVVTPGEILTINVGRGGPLGGSQYPAASQPNSSSSSGGDSEILRGGTVLVRAKGSPGRPATVNKNPPYQPPDGRVLGGDAALGVFTGTSGGKFSGGRGWIGAGGAAGYTGNGGDGWDGFSSSKASYTTSPGGGGGGGSAMYWFGSGPDEAVSTGAGGGGTGLFGLGTNGTGSPDDNYNNIIGGGTGGSGGGNGGNARDYCPGCGETVAQIQVATGGYPGGGGGIGYAYTYGQESGAARPSYRVGGCGGAGAVRIVWPGTTRQFPSTNVGP